MKSLRINIPMWLLTEATPAFAPGEINLSRKLSLIDRRVPFLLMYQTLIRLGHTVAGFAPGECDLNLWWTGKWVPESEREKSVIFEVAWLPRWHYQVSPTGSNFGGHYAHEYQFTPLSHDQETFIRDYLARQRALFAQSVNARKVEQLRAKLRTDFVLFPFQLANDFNLRFSDTAFARFYTTTDENNLTLAQACVDETAGVSRSIAFLFKQHPFDLTPDFKGRLRTDQIVFDNTDDYSPHEIFATGRCRAVVSINSNTLHEAVAWNIPAICLGKLIWDHTTRVPPFASSLNDLERVLEVPPYEDAKVLAYVHHLVRNRPAEPSYAERSGRGTMAG